MPEIKPFRGILYNPEKVRLPEVVAPPYDVISPQQQDDLYQLSPHNIIRLILNRDEDRYNSAAKFFEEWLRDGTLVRDQLPAVYLLSQHFVTPGDKVIIRNGFIAACRLEEFGRGSVLPHEKTLAKPKEDRLRLFTATKAMFSQIFALYSDPNHTLSQVLAKEMNRAPEIDIEFEAVRQRVWKITDDRVTLAIGEYLLRQHVLVADGHHRYETAIAYCNAQRLHNPNHSGKEAYNFVPMFFTDMHEPGLVILPTHRILHGIADFNQEKMIRDIGQVFELETQQTYEQLAGALAGQPAHSFGMILPASPEFTLLRLKKQAGRSIPGVPPLLLQLDATILHALILKNILHLSDEDQAKKLNLDYEKDAQDALQAVQNGRAQAAFLMNGTPIEQVRAIAEAGHTMPQKSTYFYPKLLSGLVTYSFIDDTTNTKS
jgi:uncharacterized protein (DUF1015 family)